MSEKEQPALPASAEDPRNNPAHLLIALAPPNIVNGITEEIHYDDLAVIGASPVSNTESNGDAESAVAALASDHLKNTTGQIAVHIASFKGQEFDPDGVIAYLDDIEKLEGKLDFHTVPLESVSGLRAYLEECVGLTPEGPPAGADSYCSVVPGTGSLDPDARGELLDRISEIEETMGLAPEEPEAEIPEEAPPEEPAPSDETPTEAPPLPIPVGFCWVTRKHLFNVGEITCVTYEGTSCVIETANHGKFELEGDDANAFVSTFLR